MFTSVIIVAAGNSARMGNNINKIFLNLCGKPVISYSVEEFNKSLLTDEIIIVSKKDNFDKLSQICGKIGMKKPVKFVEGGNTRSESVLNGLSAADDRADFLAIHDGARPMITAETADKLISLAKEYGCVAPCTPVYDTVKQVDGDMTVVATPDRDHLKTVQTPQVFKKDIYMRAVKSAEGNNYSDDCALVENIGKKVHLFELVSDNIKITRKDDINRAESLLSLRKGSDITMRIGQGYDVHKLKEGRKLIIGGIEIPYELGLDGHSDADVLTHAIMDAMLGAAAMGDIGKLFPDNDDNYKGADSIELLKKVNSLLLDKGFGIINIDCTLIAQKPKLAPYIQQIRENYSNALGIDISCINVKATTEEGLGFTGTNKGMAAQAVCLLKG
ncbi:MAG: 2-C-methyl-D-erythritol 2,4-cyclodiphosphate synthase [Clostridiales bacterium]|nr:2-C-methyl-D-erythritol 2,4-cyclodiphosphate synthase [Clostridiales bacterium]